MRQGRGWEKNMELNEGILRKGKKDAEKKRKVAECGIKITWPM